MTKVMYSDLGNSHTFNMAMGDDVQRTRSLHKKTYNHHQPRDVEQVLDCVRKDGCRYYKIRWKDTWESEECLGPFHKFVKEFWDKVEKSRHDYHQHHIHSAPPQNGYHSPPPPPHRQHEASPTHMEYTHHSPIYRHDVEQMQLENTVEGKEELSPSSDNRVMTSSPPSLSSGRRKGKPKKLVNHVDRSLSPSSYNNNNNTIHSPYLTQTSNELSKNNENIEENSISRFTPPRSEKDSNLTVDIPETTAESPRSENGHSNGNLEEYPVMIIRENGEEPVMSLKEQQKRLSPYALHEQANKLYNGHSPNCLRLSPQSEHMRSFKDNEHHLRPIIHTPPNTSPEDNSDHHRNAPLSPVFQKTTLRPIPQHILPQHNRYTPHEKLKNYHPSNPPPMIYHTRVLPHRKGQLVNPHYIYADPRNPIEMEKFEKFSDSKFETSQLLLKVTGSNPPTASTTSQPSDHHQQFPVYQTTKVTAVNPTPKKRTRDTNKGRKTPTKYLTTADGEQRPQCSECFQTFKKRAALERHMMIHRGIKPFQCHFCNQRFRQKHHLQGHIMLHTGERPHSCTLCNKRFRMRHHLLEHERISHKVFR